MNVNALVILVGRVIRIFYEAFNEHEPNSYGSPGSAGRYALQSIFLSLFSRLRMVKTISYYNKGCLVLILQREW